MNQLFLSSLLNAPTSLSFVPRKCPIFQSHNIHTFEVQMAATLINMPPADLTPAVDKFPKLPSEKQNLPKDFHMAAKGPAPEGPDPFSYVSDELQPLADYVRELVVSENPVLTMAASHFFEKVSFST